MIAAAVVLAAYAGTVELADRTEARVRATQGQPVAYDAVNIPSLRAAVNDRRWSYTLAYAPSLILQDLQASVTPVIFNSGTLAASWHNRVARLTLREEGTYGEQNTANLALVTTGLTPDGRPQPLQALPQAQSITIASSRTTLSTELRPARRWNLTAAVGYNLFGGVDAASRAVIPSQRGPLADASATYAVSKVDAAVAALSATSSQFSESPCVAIAGRPPPAAGATCAPENGTAVATAGWHHVFSRTTDAAIGAGVSGVRTRLSAVESFQTHVYPAALANITYRLGFGRHRATARLDAQVAPVIDFRNGIADNRAQATAFLTWRQGDLTLSQSLGISRSFGNELVLGGTFVTSGTDAQYEIGRHATLGAGLRYVWQKQDGGGDGLSSAIGFIAFTVRSSALKF